MIGFDAALQRVLSFGRATPALETVPLQEAQGRVLPKAVTAVWDQPPFDKAAMDGWAHGEERDSVAPLLVRNTIAAGVRDDEPVKSGEAKKIMTGAPMPPGARRVHRVEWSEYTAQTARFTRAERSDNVICRGENMRAGDVLLTPRVLRAPDLAVLAADGRATVEVARRPVVGVLSTGSELVEPGGALGAGAIYDSNRTLLLAQLADGAAELIDLGIVPDEHERTRVAIADALARVDILALSGGVSMGDFDHVPRALAECGVVTEFHGVAVKPGRPTYFGRRDGTFVFGLAGNPVAVFVLAELFVRPLLLGLSGLVYEPPVAPAPVPEALTRRSTDRVEFLPVALARDGVRRVVYGGPSALQALTATDGLVRFEVGQREIPLGGVTDVRRVR